MAAIRLALRYRNFDPNVDTITEHNSILQKRGHVWWGWWRKAFEDKQVDLLERLREELPFCAWLVDNTQEQQTQVMIDAIAMRSDDIDLDYVPEYYRASAAMIDVWFRIIGLQRIEYERAVGDSMGQPTLYEVAEDREKPLIVPVPRIGETQIETRSEELILVQLSDIHIGSDHNFRLPDDHPVVAERRPLAECLAEDLARQGLNGRIDAVVISGDLVSRGDWKTSNSEQLTAVIRDIAERSHTPLDKFIITPGNHDFERYDAEGLPKKMTPVEYAISKRYEAQFRRFIERVLGVAEGTPLNRVHTIRAAGFDLKIGQLNSCNVTASEFTEYGYVGEEIRKIAAELGEARPAIRVLILHHHLLPVQYVEVPKINGVSVTLDASTILDQAQRNEIRLILHGHKHLPHLSKVANAYFKDGRWLGLDHDVYISSAGSTGSRDLPDDTHNTYSVFRVRPKETEVTVRQLSPAGREMPNYLSLTLPIQAS